MTLKRFFAAGAVAAAASIFTVSTAFAAGHSCATDNLPASMDKPGGFPARALTMIVPYGPAGGSGQVAQAMAQAVSDLTKVSINRDHKPGGSGTVGMTAYMAAPADGYTVLEHIDDASSAHALDSGRPNPGLSAKGAGRARELVRAIGELPLDDGVAALFATRYRASQETARPLAQHLDLPVQIVDAADHDPLLQRIATGYQGQVLIVVTDADALAALVGGLLRRAFTVHDPAVDRLYLVTVPRIGAPSAVALRYGAPAATSTGS